MRHLVTVFVVLLLLAAVASASAWGQVGDLPAAIDDPVGAFEPGGEPQAQGAAVDGAAQELVEDGAAQEPEEAGVAADVGVQAQTHVGFDQPVRATGQLPFTGPLPGRLMILVAVGSLAIFVGSFVYGLAAVRP